MTEPSADDRQMQLAIDAFAVRHHAAEALVRFLTASLCARTLETPTSVWAELANGPTRLVEVVDRLRSMELAVDEVFLTPLQRSDPANEIEAVVQALKTCGAWIDRSMAILCGGGLDANAGHNKIKHGLAMRGHGDVLFSVLSQGPVDGELALSAAQGGVPLIDAVSMEFLTKHRSGSLK